MLLMIFASAYISDEQNEKFSAIYDRFRNLLFTKAYDILKDHMLAEDALSEAFIRIYRNLDKVEDISTARTAAFLVTIVKNVAIEMYNKRKREVVQFPDVDIPDERPLDDSVIENISLQEIYSIVESLDEQLKNIFLLKYSFGMSHKEIAKTMNITENNVTVKLHRTKKRLSQLLVKGGYVDE